MLHPSDNERGRKIGGLAPLRGILAGAGKSPTWQALLPGPILIRQSADRDRAALQRLAALDSRRQPNGTCLLAEVNGGLVAAAPLDLDVEPISDPFRHTANVRELLELEARHIRRNRAASVSQRRGATARQRMRPLVPSPTQSKCPTAPSPRSS